MHRMLVAVTFAPLALCACSQQVPQPTMTVTQAAPAPQPMDNAGPATGPTTFAPAPNGGLCRWEWSDPDGFRGTLDLSKVETEHKNIAVIENAKKIMGVTDAPTYYLIHMDNTNGTQYTGVAGLTAVDSDGAQMKSQSLDDLINDWRSTRGSSLSSADYNVTIDAANSIADSDGYVAGSKGDSVIAFPRPVKSVKTISIDHGVIGGTALATPKA